MVASLWDDKTKAWLGWRAGKGRAWRRGGRGCFSSENGAVLDRVNYTHYLAFTGGGGHQENQIGIEKQDKGSRTNEEQPMGQIVPTEKILKSATEKFTKRVENTPSASESCVQ